jgi:mono/diheme cytochrome c family protein
MIENKKRIIILMALSLLAVLHACRINYPVEHPAHVTISRRPELQAEGKRLAMVMCASCHYDAKTKSLTGKRMEDTPGIVGKVYSANITNDPTTGIAHYSDQELVVLFRTGVSREGRFMPYMLRPNLADEDIAAIITFLRSDDALVAPKPNTIAKTRYTPIGKFGISRNRPLPYSDQPVRKPMSDTLALGKYLVDNLACYHCHSKSFLALDYRSPEKSKGYMGGGNKLKGADGKTISTPNLTFHETGLKGWTENDLILLLRQGITPDKKFVRPPMPILPELTDAEIVAMYRYLSKLPPVENDTQ